MSPRAKKVAPQLIFVAVLALAWASPAGQTGQPAAPTTYEEAARKAKAYDDFRTAAIAFLTANAVLAGTMLYNAGRRKERVEQHSGRLDVGEEELEDLRKETKELQMNLLEHTVNLANTMRGLENLRDAFSKARHE